MVHVEITRAYNEESACRHELGENFPDGMEHALRKLDRSFIDSRYPNGVGGAPEDFYDAPSVQELKQCCLSVMEFVKSRLS